MSRRLELHGNRRDQTVFSLAPSPCRNPGGWIAGAGTLAPGGPTASRSLTLPSPRPWARFRSAARRTLWLCQPPPDPHKEGTR